MLKKIWEMYKKKVDYMKEIFVEYKMLFDLEEILEQTSFSGKNLEFFFKNMQHLLI